jgi:hypothetical protein
LSEEKKARFFYEVGVGSYNGAKDALASLDSKINNLFTLDVALITVVTGLTYFIVEKLVLAGKYQPILLTPIAISLALLVISVIIGIVAYSPSERNVVDPVELIQTLQKYPIIGVLKHVAGTFAYAGSKNDNLVNEKAGKVRWMSWFVMLALAFAAIGFMWFFSVID